MANQIPLKEKRRTKNGAIKLIILILAAALAYGALVLPDLLNQQTQMVEVGEVSTQEILAPYSVTFESRVLSDSARDAAAAAVQPVYLPPDPDIARAQLEKLGNTLYFISTVRNDNYSTQIQKIQDLKSLAELRHTDAEYINMLELSEPDWQAISTEANRVLEVVLRDSIRNSQLGTIKSNLPAVIDFSFPSDQTKLIISLVSPFIVPTSLFSEEQTQTAREQARASVEPITRQIMAGEVLVRRGEIVSPSDLEALTAFGLGEPTDRAALMLSSGAIVTVVALLVLIYYQRTKRESFNQLSSVLLIAFFFLLFLGLARFLVMDRTILPYLFPIAAFGLTLGIVFNLQFSIFYTLLLVALSVYGHVRSTELALYYLLPTIAGMLVLGKGRRVSAFLLTSIVISVVSAVVIIAFRLGDGNTDWIGIASLIGAGLFNGVASGTFALLLQNIFAFVLDVPTALQLLDISRPDHPLLQHILTNAPGTYQHSLQVSNLAEQAADAIGADRLLVRVGALYHDAGKAENPTFFIENQVREKIDSHENVDPTMAAATIIRHVSDGVALAKKYRLPSRIIDFMREHHGSNMTRYQYSHALELADNPEDVDVNDFKYPGPSPRSKETALLMLADGTEARARANTPRSDEEIIAVIDSVFEVVQGNGQLDNTDLTLRDLQTIKRSFFNTLKQSYHPRIKYPEMPKKAQSSTATEVKSAS
ncbi:MAG: HDIG domain-containing protein [Chloroflexi bacterium]|nr:HDIG domain-containing protein [Chloroflexota bacterium]